MFTKCTFERKVSIFTSTNVLYSPMLNLDFVQVSLNLLKHEMQLSGDISIGLMVE